MLETTKNIKEDLKGLGFKNKDIRVRTTFIRKTGGKVSITIFNNENYLKFKIIRALLRLNYGVIITGKNYLIISADYQLSRKLNVYKGNNKFKEYILREPREKC